MTKIKVKPEGREGLFIADEESLIDFIESMDVEDIHNFIQAGSIFLGADWQKDTVIEKIRHKDSISAILTGEHYAGNMSHALSVTDFKTLYMFDIGEISIDQLDISPNTP